MVNWIEKLSVEDKQIATLKFAKGKMKKFKLNWMWLRLGSQNFEVVVEESIKLSKYLFSSWNWIFCFNQDFDWLHVTQISF